MVNRESALSAHYHTGHFGAKETGVILKERTGIQLTQIAAWPDSLAEVGQCIAAATGCDQAPAPTKSQAGAKGTLLRIEPLKWWLLGSNTLPTLSPEQAVVLDLSHSRCCIGVEGEFASELLNRHLPLDLRVTSFAEGAVASTTFHHVGVTVWRHQHGYDLFIPRGFAVSLWELLLESAEQFGVDVV